MQKFKNLGEIKTVGELRKSIEGFADETPFGFRNQPMQDLVIVTYVEKTFVCFQEKGHRPPLPPGFKWADEFEYTIS